MEAHTNDLYEYNFENENEADFSVRRNHGFVDHATASADILNVLLATYIPLGIDWSVSQTRWSFRLTGVTVCVTNDPGSRIDVRAESDVMGRPRLDALRHALRGIVAAALLEPSWSATAFGTMLVQLAEEASSHVQEFQRWQPPQKKLKLVKGSGWNATSVNDWTKVLNDPHGVDLMTVNDTAKFLLGRSIADIIKDCDLEDMRVLHVEPVFRSDLVNRFMRRRQEIHDELMDLNYEQLRECISKQQLRDRSVEATKESIANHLSTPHVTFHGAPRPVVSSIVRYGLAKPGTVLGKKGPKVEIECGASFGIGIYSSPSFSYASMYGDYDWGRSGRSLCNPADVPGLRIVVCATLMGRPLQVTRDATRRTEELYAKGAHSHVSPNKMEYIVFNAAQIIPCYVLHLDFGHETAREHFDMLVKDPLLIGRSRPRVDHRAFAATDEGPGAKKAKKEALKAAAAKWFPYGFGPATGTNFVIEEIGEISDDEEEYGEFQAIRGEKENEIVEHEARRADEKFSWFDEYQQARSTYSDVRPEKRSAY